MTLSYRNSVVKVAIRRPLCCCLMRTGRQLMAELLRLCHRRATILAYRRLDDVYDFLVAEIQGRFREIHHDKTEAFVGTFLRIYRP